MKDYIIVQTIVDVSCSSQLLISHAPLTSVTTLVAVGAIGLVSILLTINQSFYVLNNNVNLCFQTWKYVPSNFGI
jgi:hypothetical protein